MITLNAWALSLIGLFTQPVVPGPVAVAEAVHAAVQDGLQEPEVLYAGEEAMLVYHDPEKANSSVTVIVDNGKWGPAREYYELHFDLDGEGFGVVTWFVPARDWDRAHFEEDEQELFDVEIVGGGSSPR